MSEPTLLRPASSDYAPYYERYISLIPEGDILGTLSAQLDETLSFLAGIPESRAGHRYAPGKWSIREVVGHLIDGEKIFGDRALRIGRGDTTPLPGFDEDAYVANANFDNVALADLAHEFELARRSNIMMFRHFPREAWERRGTANGNPVSVIAIAFIMAGHEMHHAGVIRSRYLTIAEPA
jgi:hypothetical protein